MVIVRAIDIPELEAATEDVENVVGRVGSPDHSSEMNNVHTIGRRGGRATSKLVRRAWHSISR